MRRLVAAAAILAFAGLAAACAETESRGQQRIVAAEYYAGVLSVIVGTCNGDPEAEVTEASNEVTVTVTSTYGSPGDVCQGSWEVPQAAPMSGRTLVDGVTGDAVEVWTE